MSPKTEKFLKSHNTCEDNHLNIPKSFTHNEGNLLKSDKPSMKTKDLKNIMKNEYSYISNYFNILEAVRINHGKRKLSEEDEDEDFQLLNIPEKKIFKKTPSKKGNAQTSTKQKPFPQTIDGIEKELEELKGTSMTYQKKLRKKGLQSRLVKKKRKEHKALLKQGKKGNSTVNGPAKLIKPVLNSNGNVVSNKFDFADYDNKKESKPKLGSDFNRVAINVKKEHDPTDAGVSIKQEEKSPSGQGSVLFNRDNKMVFSKVFVPENNKKHKKKTVSDPRKILDKLKENSKKLSELEKEDKEKAASIKEKQKWSAALKRASGEKVRDDPELLRKTISKEKNIKARSQKKWKARVDKVQKDKEDRQKKRTENIQARKTDKKKRKMKKAIKKGSYVPL